MGLYQALGCGEGLLDACKKEVSLILSLLCSLLASSLFKHPESLDIWWFSVFTSHGAWAGLLKPGPSVLSVLTPWVPMEPSLCVLRHHCRAKPGSSPTALSTPNSPSFPSAGASLPALATSPSPSVSSVNPSFSLGVKWRKHKPENLAGFLFCALPFSCPKAMNQRAGYLLWWGEKSGKHGEEIYLN